MRDWVKGKTPMEIDHEQRRQKFAGRKIIKENVTHAEWIEGSNRKKWPVGATWSAALGTVYGE